MIDLIKLIATQQTKDAEDRLLLKGNGRKRKKTFKRVKLQWPDVLKKFRPGTPVTCKCKIIIKDIATLYQHWEKGHFTKVVSK